MRAPFQVLVIPYRRSLKTGLIKYFIFKRKDIGYWQFIAGGGEDSETPHEAAKRELYEETGITAKLLKLKSRNTIPIKSVTGKFTWGKSVLVIPEFAFATEIGNHEIKLSKEHSEYKAVAYQGAVAKLKWESNKTALWELKMRLLHHYSSFNDEHVSR